MEKMGERFPIFSNTSLITVVAFRSSDKFYPRMLLLMFTSIFSFFFGLVSITTVFLRS